MPKFANRSPFGTSQRTAYGISIGVPPPAAAVAGASSRAGACSAGPGTSVGGVPPGIGGVPPEHDVALWLPAGQVRAVARQTPVMPLDPDHQRWRGRPERGFSVSTCQL